MTPRVLYELIYSVEGLTYDYRKMYILVYNIRKIEPNNIVSNIYVCVYTYIIYIFICRYMLSFVYLFLNFSAEIQLFSGTCLFLILIPLRAFHLKQLVNIFVIENIFTTDTKIHRSLKSFSWCCWKHICKTWILLKINSIWLLKWKSL